MNEFEWRRQLRDLRADVEPPAPVWTAIAARIEIKDAEGGAGGGSDRSRHPGHWGRPALAVAATLVIGIGIAMTFAFPPALSPGVAVAEYRELPDGKRSPTGDADALYSELAHNPVLAATDAELRELQEQIQRALAVQPGSARLRRMLSRTASERRRLIQYQSQLG